MDVNQARILKEKNEVILEYIDFAWTDKEIKQCQKLWDAGYSLIEIANRIRKTGHKEFETFALLYDLITRKIIKEREGKMWGFKQ